MARNPNNLKFSKELTKAAVVHKSLLGIKKKYDALFNQNINGLSFTCKIVFDDNNQPICYGFLEVNAAFEKQTGSKKKKMLLGRTSNPNNSKHQKLPLSIL